MQEVSSKYRSPNYGERPKNVIIDSIVIHYTDMYNAELALKRLCDKNSEVSSHYLISKKGIIYSLVPDEFRAWHAGPSYWRGRERVNDFSIGIEIDNGGYEEFTQQQMNSLIMLCKNLQKKHPIDPLNIVGHSDIAPSRKFDPGRMFKWELLAKNNIGVFPKAVAAKIPGVKLVQSQLRSFGYKLDITEVIDQQTVDVMRAFNEHYNPSCYNIWNEFSQGALDELCKII